MTDTNRPDIESLWDYSDPAGTEAALRAALAEADDPDYARELLTQIARTFSLRGQFDRAHDTLDVVERELAQASPLVQVRYLLERGRSFNSAGRKPEATALFISALELAERDGLDYHAVDAAHMLGIVAPLDEQMRWHLRAIALAEAATDVRAHNWLGALYNNMGWTLHDAGDYTEALAMFQRGVAFREAQREARALRIARWAVARTLRSLGRFDEALDIQLALQRDWADAGAEDGYVYEEIAECLTMLGRMDEARPHFARAYALLSDDDRLASHEEERLSRLRRLGGEPGNRHP